MLANEGSLANFHRVVCRVVRPVQNVDLALQYLAEMVHVHAEPPRYAYPGSVPWQDSWDPFQLPKDSTELCDELQKLKAGFNSDIDMLLDKLSSSKQDRGNGHGGPPLRTVLSSWFTAELSMILFLHPASQQR